MPTDDQLREAQDPGTSAARLQELAQADRGLWTTIASHPAAYPGLLDWLAEHGDDTVREAIANRASVQSIPAPPPPPPVAPAAAEPSAPHEPVTAPLAAAAPDAPDAPAAPDAPTAADAPANGRRNRIIALVLVAIVAIAAIGWVVWDAVADDEADDIVGTTSGPAVDLPEKKPAEKKPEESPAPGSGDFCEVYAEMEELSLEQFEPLTTDDPADALAESQARLDELDALYERLESASPDEIREDITVMREFLDTSSDLAAGETPDFDGYFESAQAVSTYSVTNCL